jgi:uncharacterized protein HemX
MENVNASTVYSLLLIIVAVCSICGFVLGQRKQIREDAESDTGIKKDLKTLQQAMNDLKESIKAIEDKLEHDREERRKDMSEYQKNVTELSFKVGKIEQDCKSAHKRIDYLQKIMRVKDTEVEND